MPETTTTSSDDSATEAYLAMCKQLCLANVCNAVGLYYAARYIECEFNGSSGTDNTLATLVAAKCPYGGDFDWLGENGDKCSYTES